MTWVSLDVAANSSTWTAVTPPFECDMLAIRNTGGSALRYSADEGATEDALEPGGQFSVPVHRFANWWMPGGPRFAAGAPAVYLKMVAGTGIIKVTFLR